MCTRNKESQVIESITTLHSEGIKTASSVATTNLMPVDLDSLGLTTYALYLYRQISPVPLPN
jgi:hypothetical protein